MKSNKHVEGDITLDDVASQDVASQDVASQDIASEDIASQNITSESITSRDIAPQDNKPESSELQRTHAVASTSLPEVVMHDSGHAELRVGQHHLTLTLEPDVASRGSWIRAALCPNIKETELVARSALRLNARLPNNSRYARVGGKLTLVADAYLPPSPLQHATCNSAPTSRKGKTQEPTLPFPPLVLKEIEEIRGAFEQALSELDAAELGATETDTHHPSAPTPQATEALSSVLEALSHDPTWKSQVEVVRRDHDYELRLHLGGAPIPLRLQLCEQGLKIDRLLDLHRHPPRSHSADLPSDHSAIPLVEEALQLNGLLRYSRIANGAAGWVAETILHSDSIVDTSSTSRETIVTAALAVASNTLQCHGVLRVLACNAQIAECYAQLLQHEQLSQPTEQEQQC